jgi:hypothetical protein
MRRNLLLLVLTLILVSASVPALAFGQEARGGPAPATGEAAPDFELPAVQVRLALDRTLGEHAFLSIEAMRTGITGGDEFDVAAEVLEANTIEVVDLVEAAYGADAADAFAEQWRNHIAYLVDYTRAVAEGDTDARDLASAQLQTYTQDFSAFLIAANPTLPADVVEGLIQEHVQQLEQIGNFAAEGFEDAYPSIRETYAHMFMVGDGLANGITARFPERFPGRSTAFSPALNLRLSLDRLLGEHTYLAAIAMRAGLTDAPDFEAAADALDGNSADLAAQITQIYGEDAGDAFDELWRSHTRFYLDYVEASADGNAAAKTQALEGLREYREDFSSFLAGANPFLDQAGLAALLRGHTSHLVSQVSRYLSGDFEGAYVALRQAYEHTESIAAGLAGAIADQFPLIYPDTALAPPGSDPRPLPVAWLVATATLITVTAVMAQGRRRGSRES